jgi:hypothetical protein
VSLLGPSFYPQPDVFFPRQPSVNTFRINTSETVTKQATLSSFGVNTYAKTGGGGRLLLTKRLLPRAQSSPLYFILPPRFPHSVAEHRPRLTDHTDLAQLLSFHILANSFALCKTLSSIFSIKSELFAQNTRGGVYPLPSNALRRSRSYPAYLLAADCQLSTVSLNTRSGCIGMAR